MKRSGFLYCFQEIGRIEHAMHRSDRPAQRSRQYQLLFVPLLVFFPKQLFMSLGKIFPSATADSQKRQFPSRPLFSYIALHCFTHDFGNALLFFGRNVSNLRKKIFIGKDSGSFHAICMIYADSGQGQGTRVDLAEA